MYYVWMSTSSITFGVIQACNSLLFGHVPNDEQIICASTGKHLRVLWTPRYGCDGLFVFRHDRSKFKLIVSVIKLEKKEAVKNILHHFLKQNRFFTIVEGNVHTELTWYTYMASVAQYANLSPLAAHTSLFQG